MTSLDGPQWVNSHWTNKWLNNIEENKPKNNQYETGLRYSDDPFYQWSNSSMLGRHDFPTTHLERMDAVWGEKGHKEHWDKNPEIARRQKPLKNRPSGVDRTSVNTSHPEFIHEMMKGTGAPEHVTVYHRGDIPKDAQYASGSVLPDWVEQTRTGGRKNDVSINRGRLHIHLVPHDDILHAGTGAEGEVFFRRGLPLNKTKRTKKKQKRVETHMEDVLELDYEQPRNKKGKFSTH